VVQGVQEEAFSRPGSAPKVPAAHGEPLSLPGPHQDPRGQIVGVTVPLVGQMWRARHGTHELEPGLGCAE
jgi:hypothetical protein